MAWAHYGDLSAALGGGGGYCCHDYLGCGLLRLVSRGSNFSRE